MSVGERSTPADLFTDALEQRSLPVVGASQQLDAQLKRIAVDLVGDLIEERLDFTERLLRGLLAAMEHAANAERLAARGGLLQRMDPRIKTLASLALILTAVLVKSLLALGGLFGAAIALALFSRVSVARLAGQAWIGVLLFTGVLAAPALFLVPGETLARLPLLDWTISSQGLRSAGFLIGRAETAATYALLVILTHALAPGVEGAA